MHDIPISALEDHLVAPRGRGRLSGSPHAGIAGGAACGDSVRIAVEVDGDRVSNVGFEASGCAAARAAGSAVYVASTYDGPLGIAAAVHAAAALLASGRVAPCGLATLDAFADPAGRPPALAVSGGSIAVPAGPGLLG